ncbi:MAG: hypothetical protein K1X94_11840 [Sandaracinaceae bacterium]|nr:hypothetical protein [Sandaracinaceae bacterium]
MERPQSILGLATHLVRVRWQALSPRGRMAAVVVAAVVGASGAFAVRSAMSCGSECCAHGGCPMAQAQAQDDGELPPCHARRGQ